MKKFTCLILIFIIATSLISFPVLGDKKWIRQSEIQPIITDAADQSETSFNNPFETIWYFHGAREYNDAYNDGWVRSWLRNAGSRFGCRNWYDPVGDSIMPIRLGGSPYGTSDMNTVQFAVPDSLGITIKKYYRHHPPTIVVDGVHLERPYPLLGDYYAPDKVWGTADVMVESHARNWMGLDIYQRVLSWVSKHHDQYVVYDWTIVNTGNIDLDDTIEREGESLDSLYFMRQLEMTVNSETPTKAEWYTWSGVYPDWDEPKDSVRCVISYYAMDWVYGGGTPWKGDAFGCFLSTRDYLDDPCSGCEVMLYVPQSSDVAMGPGPDAENGNPENHPETDDVIQPKSHGNWGPDDFEYKHNSGIRSIEDWQQCYNAMIYGEKGDPDYDPYVEWMTGTYPGTYHPVPPDMRGYEIWNDLDKNGHVFWHAMCQAGMGPFHLDYGDSLRIVWADCGGRLSARSSWELGQAWKDSSITFVTRSDDTLDINDISLTAPYLPNQADTIYIPPVYRNNPSRWQPVEYPPSEYTSYRANLIKDMWVYSTVDSAVRHAINAQWNFDHNYDIPVPPPPPSIEVTSGADQIVIEWWYEEAADIPSDLAGYRVYRSTGSEGQGPLIENTGVLGEWELIFQCGGTDPGGDVQYSSGVVDTYNDTTAVRGEDYYYYVAAFDDGTHPEAEDPNGVTGTAEVLESGRWQNHTYGVVGAASLKRTTGDSLSQIRVVPNPFNIASSKNMGYSGDSEKINFFNLPGNCTIKIYNFSGDLIKTIEHNDGSGDEAWENPTGEWYQVTEAGQHIVSGLYIANIVDNETGESINIKFVIIR
jgi:hypothetical protein